MYVEVSNLGFDYGCAHHLYDTNKRSNYIVNYVFSSGSKLKLQLVTNVNNLSVLKVTPFRDGFIEMQNKYTKKQQKPLI